MKSSKSSENNPDEQVPTTIKKQYTILHYVKGIYLSLYEEER
jgi:hypothetical protein